MAEYSKVGPWVNGGAPALSAANLDTLETQYPLIKSEDLTFAGLKSFSGTILVAQDIQHIGDTDTLIEFTADAISLETGGASRIDLSDTGFRIGGAGARVTGILDEDAMGSDSAVKLCTQQSIKAYTDNQLSGRTREEFCPVTHGTDMTVKGYYPGALINANTDFAYIQWTVPDGFTSLTEAELCWIAITGVANFNILVVTQWAAHDEQFDANTDTDDFTINPTTADDVYLNDIAAAFTGIAAGDVIGIRVACPDGATEQAHIVGIKFKYA